MARKTGSHSEITGPKVRDAALRLFAQHGFAAVSMRQIAAEVGVQAGALYNYTRDKQSLLFEIMRTHMEEALEDRERAAKSVADCSAADKLEDFVKFHIGWNLPRRLAVFIAYMELRNLTEDNFARVEELRARYENELESILKDGMADGSFRIDDSKVATLAIIGMLTGMNNWFRQDGRLSVPEVQEVYWGLVRRSVGVTE